MFDINLDINPGELWRSSADAAAPGGPNFPGSADLDGRWRTCRNASRILVPLDGSPRAERALSVAARIARTLRTLRTSRACIRRTLAISARC